MRFALVIPALNEEQAIADTLRRALASRAKVLAQTPVTDMVIVFVNDGSTDRTQAEVDQAEFEQVVKVRFEKNRGYGAAIKAGWQATDAELLGFMDADGTCDPDFCVDLVNRLCQTGADAVLAGRMHAESQMPLVRKIGNMLFARLLGLVSGKDLTDSASGFRVVRRTSLRLMTPLPDGLHFTPAMSCICLLDPRLRIEEVPMRYKERIGRSKLSVVKDGFRFLYIILFSACCYAPIKTMIATSVLFAAGWAFLVWFTLAAGVSEGAAMVFGLTGAVLTFLLLASGVVVHQLNFLLIGPRRHVGLAERWLQNLLQYKRLMVMGVAITAIGGLGMVAYGLSDDGLGVNRLEAATLLAMTVVIGLSLLVGSMIVRVIWAVGEKQKALVRDEYDTTSIGIERRTPAYKPSPRPIGGARSILSSPR